MKDGALAKPTKDVLQAPYSEARNQDFQLFSLIPFPCHTYYPSWLKILFLHDSYFSKYSLNS
jgi:hypothetical protein